MLLKIWQIYRFRFIVLFLTLSLALSSLDELKEHCFYPLRAKVCCSKYSFRRECLPPFLRPGGRERGGRMRPDLVTSSKFWEPVF